MISAVVLVNTDSGTQDKVLESLRLVDGVEEAHALYGVYGLLIKIKSFSLCFSPHTNTSNTHYANTHFTIISQPNASSLN